MVLSLFLTYRLSSDAGPLLPGDFASCVAAVPGLSDAVLHVPTAASDPYLKDDGPPSLVLQCYFDGLDSLESASRRSGALQALLDPLAFTWLAGADVTQQAMVVRSHPVKRNGAVPPRHCAYLVGYEGAPESYDTWLGHYLDHHLPLMFRLPDIRLVEIYTRLDWMTSLSARRETFVQRNKVVFEGPEALTQALHSPVRTEMRRDYEASPPFDGRNVHYPMTGTMVSHAVPACYRKETR